MTSGISHFFLIFLLQLNYCNTHPQCLDFRPPYKPTKALHFCSDSSAYSCCTSEKDKDFEKDYEHAKERSAEETVESCEVFLKKILCLECHPYAAHIFDAEIPKSDNATFDKRHVSFPGLCKAFCLEQFEKCRSVLLLVARNNDFYNFMKNASKVDFCKWAEIPDKNYCYPNVEAISDKEAIVDIHDDVTLCVEALPASFSNALVAVHSNDGTHRMFVGEQSGVVYVVDERHRKLDAPFLNISDRIINSGVPWDERGFLGLVFHPRFRTNGHFYVYYSAPNGGHNRSEYSNYEWYWKVNHKTRLSEFTVDANNPNVADHNSELIIMEINQPEANHNGGMLLFGTDGYLYVFPGDGGGVGDGHWSIGNGLNMSTLLGKVLRIDINNDTALYGIPPDNPFLSSSDSRPEIYAFGLRNPWRCSVDYLAGVGSKRIFCGDVGQSRFEEIDIIEKGGNYGWRAYEGYECFDKKLCDTQDNVNFPILVYNHSIGQSIVGGYVYRGCDNPAMYGKYFYADTMQGKIFLTEERNSSWVTKEVVMGNSSTCNNRLSGIHHINILSFGQNEAGEIFILSSNYPNPNYQMSTIYRLVDPKLRGDPEICTFPVKKTKVLLNIKRRKIFYDTQQHLQKTKLYVATCLDAKKYICTRYFKPRNDKMAFIKCSSAVRYAKQNCRKTCNYCER